MVVTVVGKGMWGRLKYWRREEDEAAGEDGRGTRGFPFSNINIVTDSCKNKREKSSLKKFIFRLFCCSVVSNKMNNEFKEGQ